MDDRSSPFVEPKRLDRPLVAASSKGPKPLLLYFVWLKSHTNWPKNFFKYILCNDGVCHFRSITLIFTDGNNWDWSHTLVLMPFAEIFHFLQNNQSEPTYCMKTYHSFWVSSTCPLVSLVNLNKSTERKHFNRSHVQQPSLRWGGWRQS